jgi:predicted membrane GTPase involved in stress response
MLWQSGAFRARNQDVAERVMDSERVLDDLEREKGITILAKNTAVLPRRGRADVKINIVDTPGHADFGGEVERGLSMVDGVLLLVDASEGPLPQTRFVLRKALEAKLPIILVVNKIDRPTPASRGRERGLRAVHRPRRRRRSRSSSRSSTPTRADGTALAASTDGGPAGHDLGPLFDTILETIPPRCHDPEHPLQALVTNLDASPTSAGSRCAASTRHDPQGPDRWRGAAPTARSSASRLTELYITEALDRVDAEEAGPRARSSRSPGIPESPSARRSPTPTTRGPCRVITVDEPSLGMTIGINTSPLSGRDGDKLTARLLKNRLDAELVGNVSLRVLPTERPDTWEVQGRGELQLAVLVETMRREGFELTVGKPQVVTREIDGTATSRWSGCRSTSRRTTSASSPSCSPAQGPHGADDQPRHRLGPDGVLVPARGLIGFRTEFLTETRGTGILHHVFDGYEPWHGEIRTRPNGSLVADRSGPGDDLRAAQPPGARQLFIEPGDRGLRGHDRRRERPRRGHGRQPGQGEEAHQRALGHGGRAGAAGPAAAAVAGAGARVLRTDECVEVTPANVRLRKVELDSRRSRPSRR